MRSVNAIILLAALASTATAAPSPPLPSESGRVVGLAKLWARVRLYHPYLAYKDLDWDGAFVAALPKVMAATSIDEYKAALGGMLATLHDPVTRMIDGRDLRPASSAAEWQRGSIDAKLPATAAPPKEWVTWPTAGVVELRIAGMSDGRDYVQEHADGARATAELAKAKAAVIDLRSDSLDPLDELEAAMPAIDAWPLERMVEYHGFVTQEGTTSGGYYATFATKTARAAKPAAKPGPSFVVFVTDRDHDLPAVALALQASGHAAIIADATLREAAVVTEQPVALPGGLAARVRLGEALWGVPTADVIVKPTELEARALAIAKAGGLAAAKRKAPAELPPMRLRVDNDYAAAPYPSRELRMLAGVKVWATLARFNPYQGLVTGWDDELVDVLPKLDAARDEAAYQRALREMVVHAHDGHINIWHPAEMAQKHWATLPFATRLVEGKLTVMRLAPNAKSPVAVGDVIETIDGKPAEAQLADALATTSGSTEAARRQIAAVMLPLGDPGTSVALGVRGANGALRSLTLTRDEHAFDGGFPATPHWKTLANNIGYVDLTELTVPEVAPMFDALKATRAIVFDLRGYPKGTAWTIAPRINTKHAAYGAEFMQPLVRGDNEGEDMRTRFLQPIPPLPPGAAIYTGKIVVLIDDRAISQSEHTCLFFHEAADPVFVGSPTHGTNGDVTIARLPGGLRMSFTGQGVRFVDGKRLAQVGIQPTIAVQPTIAGIRAGKDEVLDRALAYLATGR